MRSNPVTIALFQHEHIFEDGKEYDYQYDCEMLSFFELGSLHHDYYLVNIKVPVEPYSEVNTKIGKLRGINLVVRHSGPLS